MRSTPFHLPLLHLQVLFAHTPSGRAEVVDLATTCSSSVVAGWSAGQSSIEATRSRPNSRPSRRPISKIQLHPHATLSTQRISSRWSHLILCSLVPSSTPVSSSAYILHLVCSWFMQAAFLQGLDGYAQPFEVVLGDGTLKNRNTSRSREPPSMPILWVQCWAALSSLRAGGSFICKVTDSFSRSAVATYFLLCQCFGLVTIIKPRMSDPSGCEKFLVVSQRVSFVCACPGESLGNKCVCHHHQALNFKGNDHSTVKDVRDHLAACVAAAAGASEEEDVREIVPTRQILSQTRFLNSIINLNER